MRMTSLKLGWLERRFEPDGEMSWWWTAAGETALEVHNLTSSTEGRENTSTEG
jgi:hypothetical protein